MKRALVLLSLALIAFVTMGAGWLNGPRFGAGIAPGFAPVQRVAAGTDTRIAWNADPDCVYFDGSDDYTVGSVEGLPGGSDARTVMAWVYDSEPTSSSYRNFLMYGADSPYPYAFALGWIDQLISFQRASGGFTQPNTRSEAWLHYAATYPAGQYIASMTLFSNGVPNTETKTWTLGGNIILDTRLTGGANIELGRYNASYNKMKCKLAEIAFFNKVLTQEEIQAIMPYKLTGTESGLVRLYHCDEGTGNTLVDAMGTGKNITLYGATWSTK